ncbi:MAG TPA: DUF192 domain-containing protein [Hyphomonadaceae bacterium]|nr:DUF192 domain-containing protein [Hyphomonadaceae bacterium]
MKRTLLVAAFAAAFSASAMAQTPTEALSIVSAGKTHAFQVEVADTLPEISTGLSGRASLAKDHGLLMDFRQVRDQFNLNMKGVQVELDMLFIDGNGMVRAIATSARPGSLRTVAPGLGSAAVLQIAGGQAMALGIKPGDTVKNKIFGNGG